MEVLDTLQTNIDSLTAIFGMIAAPFLTVINSILIRAGVLSGKYAPFVPIGLGSVIGVLLNVSLVGVGLLSILIGVLVGGTLGAGAVGFYEAVKKGQ